MFEQGQPIKLLVHIRILTSYRSIYECGGDAVIMFRLVKWSDPY